MVTPSTHRPNIWWLLLLQGIAPMVLGLMLVIPMRESLLMLVIFLGFFWLIEGILSYVHIFVDRTSPWISSLLIAFVGIAGGLLVVTHPLRLFFMLGAQALIMGMLEIVGGFTGGGIGSFILGVINLLIGVLLLGARAAPALAVPLVFGLILLVGGIGLITWAFRVRCRTPS